MIRLEQVGNRELMKKFDIGHKDRGYVNDLNHNTAKELVQIAKRIKKR